MQDPHWEEQADLIQALHDRLSDAGNILLAFHDTLHGDDYDLIQRLRDELDKPLFGTK